MLQIHSEKTPNKLEANTLRCEDWHRRASEESYSTSRGDLSLAILTPCLTVESSTTMLVA